MVKGLVSTGLKEMHANGELVKLNVDNHHLSFVGTKVLGLLDIT